MTNKISLHEVTKSNYLDCIRLQLAEHQQGNVASNAITIAQSRFETHYHLRAIYRGDTLVGMLAYCHEDDPEDLSLFWLFRLMIDVAYQGQGIAAQVLPLVIAEVKALGASRLQTMHKPANQAAAKLYLAAGFEPIGTLDDGDVHLQLMLT